MKVAWSKSYNHPLPPNHRFPMEKYDLLPQQLLHEGTITQADLFEPPDWGMEYILQTHCPDYCKKLHTNQVTRQEARRMGFPWSPQLLQREISIANGTIQAALHSLQHGVAFNIAGGTHHAYTNRAEGFCIFNDIAVAANYLLQKKFTNKILVVDLDVHQGNGTASIFAGNSRVFTFSMHGRNNYPLHKEQSDLDIPLPDGTTDSLYLQTLQHHLPRLIEQQRPGFIFYQSGVDVLQTDKLGKLSLTIHGCKQRDEIVLTTARTRGIPLTAVMGGGYSPNIRHILEAHSNTYRLARHIYS